MNAKKRITYSIGDTALICKVSQKQIRSWEENGHIPKAERVVCGERAYRRFTPDQIEIIKKIKNYLDQGYTLIHASRMAANTQLKEDL